MGIAKQGIFMGQEIRRKIKFGHWGAALGGIVKYGLTAHRLGECVKIQQLTLECTNRIIYHKQPEHALNEIHTITKRKTNAEIRRKRCLPTERPQLHKEKYVTSVGGEPPYSLLT